MSETAKPSWRDRIRSVWGVVHTPSRPLPPQRLEKALWALRPQVLAEALWVFMVAMSLDDLQVLRFPGFLIAAAGALLVLSAGALVQSSALVRSTLTEDDDGFQHAAHRRRRRGTLGLLVTGLLAVAWLVLFSSGVPPWAA